jgi:hypothetical protein
MGKFDYIGDVEGITFSNEPKPVEPAKAEPTLKEALKEIVT